MNKSDGQDNATPDKRGNMTEYFCKVCCQLRLSLTADKSHCRNCGSVAIITGAIGSLDKPALRKQYDFYRK